LDAPKVERVVRNALANWCEARIHRGVFREAFAVRCVLASLFGN
jgi:hypothetical protein